MSVLVLRISEWSAELLSVVFLFKQKTAYEVRISDWSSDVCSSDLSGEGRDERPVYNPATAGTISKLPVATAADLDEALAAAERGWPVWRDRKSVGEGKSV